MGLARLDDEVGQGRGVDRATGAGAGDDGDLRHDARQEDILVEHLAVAGQRVDTLLDAGATRVVDEDEGCARLERRVHRLGDLDVVHLARGATGDGEVLAGEVDGTTEHRAGASDDAVSGHVRLVHAEEGGAVLAEGAILEQGSRIEQGIDALARGHRTLLVLLGDALLAATGPDACAFGLELLEAIGHGLVLGHCCYPFAGQAGSTLTVCLRPSKETL